MWVPLLAKNVLGQGAEGFGFLMAAVGVGEENPQHRADRGRAQGVGN